MEREHGKSPEHEHPRPITGDASLMRIEELEKENASLKRLALALAEACYVRYEILSAMALKRSRPVPARPGAD